MPYDFRARYQFSDLLRAAVKVSGAELKLSAECVGTSLNVFRPPATNVVDGSKNVFGRLVYRKRSGVVLIAHLTGLTNNFFYRIWLTFARGHQVAQTAGNVRTPCV